MTQPKAKVTPPKMKFPPKRMLEVEDAGSKNEFMKNALKVWQYEHRFERPRRGRSRGDSVLNILEYARENGEIKKNPSQGYLIQFVEGRLGRKKLHQDTIKKYVKLWRLVFVKGPENIDIDDLLWMDKHKVDDLYYPLSESV